MATVLEKPILLDETGQDIVSKLDEIKIAIGSTGDFIPVNIKVTTPPVKSTYASGEAFDISGMVVSLFANNGAKFDVTNDCIFTPAIGTPITEDTTINISYTWYKDQTTFNTTIKVFIKSLDSIAITSPPDVTEYYFGEQLDLTGMVVEASYNGGLDVVDITDKCTFTPAEGDTLTASDNQILVSYTEGAVIKTAIQPLEIVVICGAYWDGTSTSAWSRTDAASTFTDPIPAVNNGTGSSPFDDIMPWAGMQRVEDAVAGTLVSIPKYYYKWTREGVTMKLQISAKAFEGSHVSPAHADRGDGFGERDVVYVGAYHCGYEVYGQPQYKSLTNAWPHSNEIISSLRTNIHNLGSTIWQWDFAMYWTIMMLYLVEYADWNSQAKIGYGGSNEGSIEQSGACDDMVYHTGTNAVNRTTYGHTRYRYIEDLWGNAYDMVDGIYFSGNDIYCIKNPANFADTTGGTKVGTRASSGGSDYVVTEWTNPIVEGFEYALYPSATSQIYESDVSTIYTCDSYYNNNGTNLGVGGKASQNQQNGAFQLVGELTASYKDNAWGCRLMKLS